ncbi:rCG41930 [Rattus norvegicus]|uniref:RCG41930 n=1 Tax=Rattus norvegicus TaxID=10116 RepID=A6KKP7_RAT|nr:rCG41930 [Rattus norvegicus]
MRDGVLGIIVPSHLFAYTQVFKKKKNQIHNRMTDITIQRCDHTMSNSYIQLSCLWKLGWPYLFCFKTVFHDTALAGFITEICLPLLRVYQG